MRKIAAAILAILLLSLVLPVLSEETSETDSLYYYNPNGGSFYHLHPNCQSIAPQYHAGMRSFSQDRLGQHSDLKPCPYCVLPDGGTAWFGQAAYEQAEAALAAFRKANGAMTAYLPVGHKITADESVILITVLEESEVGIISVSVYQLAYQQYRDVWEVIKENAVVWPAEK